MRLPRWSKWQHSPTTFIARRVVMLFVEVAQASHRNLRFAAGLPASVLQNSGGKDFAGGACLLCDPLCSKARAGQPSPRDPRVSMSSPLSASASAPPFARPLLTDRHKFYKHAH